MCAHKAEDILGEMPNNATAHCILGEVALQRTFFAEAEYHFLKASTLNPGHLEALHGLGFARYSLMRLGEAIAPIDTMLKIDPTSMQLGCSARPLPQTWATTGRLSSCIGGSWRKGAT